VEEAPRPHAWACPGPQVLPQRRLTDEHQLQGVLPGRRQGRQPQHLLEGLAEQMLRFIDDEGHIAALAALLSEALL
jgi:hypothetical protein